MSDDIQVIFRASKTLRVCSLSLLGAIHDGNAVMIAFVSDFICELLMSMHENQF